ncbi:hypothetical protein GCM10008927_25690 [Amylibacter ulvae]|uniref:Nucleotidyltransferase family protein n=1 Tax=Paramylibacter ulvae TaxID=1651968 RepID=A0ABQ3D4U5_9RHOB|nr:nucleotidyltransferase family protein [Amylibacter ulvae]GHA58890.1 hypothetical protein GCM10008927_25690 [Amylibacter ulvae]
MNKFNLLLQLAQVLIEGYRQHPDTATQRAALDVIIAHWDDVYDLAIQNRVWTNLISVLVENPSLFAALPDIQKQDIKLAYFDNWAQNKRIVMQIKQIADRFNAPAKPTLFMIKGGVRLFDDLYPTLAHRFMADIDLYFEDNAAVLEFAALDYFSPDEQRFDLAANDDEYLATHKVRNHHLPPVISPSQPVHVELHQSWVHLRAVQYCRATTALDAVAINGLDAIRTPAPVDQLILNILHSQYGDLYTDYSSFRLRNVLEGYLLYQRLNSVDRATLVAHFENIGRKRDWIFWTYLCQVYFQAPEFQTAPPMSERVKYFFHRQFNQSATYNALVYSGHFLWRFLRHGIWRKEERARLMRNLFDGEKRGRLMSKLKRSIGWE